MKPIKKYSNFLNNITISKLEKYLYSQNWEKDYTFANKKINVYKKNDDFSFVIPSSEKYKDFIPKLAMGLDFLSEIDNIDVHSLITKIDKYSKDCMRFRFISETTKDGTIPLEKANKILKGIKDLIVSSACTEDDPRPYYFQPTRKAQNFANQFHLGQTEVGSFIINIESEIGDLPYQNHFELDGNICEEAPFERKIFDRIANAMDQIHTFQYSDNLDDFIEKAYLTGINANMCDALLELFPDDEETVIESSFDFSPLCNKEKLTDNFRFRKSSKYLVENIANAYRDRQIIEPIVIEGVVQKIDSQIANEEKVGGNVSITYNFENENKARNVKMYLESTDFKLACDALKEKRLLKITGNLNKTKKYWFFENTQKIEVIK